VRRLHQVRLARSADDAGPVCALCISRVSGARGDGCALSNLLAVHERTVGCCGPEGRFFVPEREKPVQSYDL